MSRVRGWRVVSIHAFRGEGDENAAEQDCQARRVSIHAFRGEGDANVEGDVLRRMVSIHAFRGEGDGNE